MPLPKESQQPPTPTEMTRRLKKMLGKQKSVDLVIEPEERTTVYIAQTGIAPLLGEERRGWRIGSNLTVVCEKTDFIMDGGKFENLKSVTEKITAKYETRLFGKPNVTLTKVTNDGKPVNSATEDITADIVTVLDQAKPKKRVEDDSKTAKEADPQSIYGRFGKETRRICQASQGYFNKLDDMVTTSLQSDGMIVNIKNNTSNREAIQFWLTLPENGTMTTADTIVKYYKLFHDQQLQESTRLNGKDAKPVGNLETDSVLSILESISTKDIKEQLEQRKETWDKTADLLRKHGEISDFGKQTQARFSSREPQVFITSENKLKNEKWRTELMNVRVEPFLSTDGLIKEFNIIDNFPIRIWKRPVADRNAPWQFGAASPEEVSELLEILNKIA